MTTSTAPQRWALVASLLIMVIGLQWWAVPESYPYGSGAESTRAAGVAGVLGSLGVVTAWASRRRLGWIGGRVAMVSTAGQAAVLGYLVPALVVGTGSLGGLDGATEDVGLRGLYVLGSMVTGALWLAIATEAIREHDGRRARAT